MCILIIKVNEMHNFSNSFDKALYMNSILTTLIHSQQN